jgi:hypothetical protein
VGCGVPGLEKQVGRGEGQEAAVGSRAALFVMRRASGG